MRRAVSGEAHPGLAGFRPPRSTDGAARGGRFTSPKPGGLGGEPSPSRAKRVSLLGLAGSARRLPSALFAPAGVRRPLRRSPHAPPAATARRAGEARRCVPGERGGCCAGSVVDHDGAGNRLNCDWGKQCRAREQSRRQGPRHPRHSAARGAWRLPRQSRRRAAVAAGTSARRPHPLEQVVAPAVSSRPAGLVSGPVT